jgi:FkbM family methyltransferase|tara:strand:+ start:1377 stop:2087 length:711 start_codon:yes stop_codon:yes gene_type:complete
MPKLKQYEAEIFTFPINGKTIKFANNKDHKTYIKNRVDRMLSKEPETINWINNFKKDSVFFDIGANIGIYTLYSAIVKENTVYSFEPHAASYKNLLDSINLNKLDKCQAFCVALSNNINLSTINVKNMHEGVAENKVGQRGDYYHGCTEMHLDFLVEKKILPQPDYIKIDVDGFEDRVIKGSLATLQKCKSALIEINQIHEQHISMITDTGLKLESKHKRNENEFNYIFINENRKS